MNFVNVHMLRSHAVSNGNRDNYNSPKEAIFGGTLRGRRSSQNFKFTLRHSDLLKMKLTGETGTELPQILSYRTRNIAEAMRKVKSVQDKIETLGGERFIAFVSKFFDTDEVKIYADNEVEQILDIICKWMMKFFAAEDGSLDVDAFFEFVNWANENMKNKKGETHDGKTFVKPKDASAKQKEVIEAMDKVNSEIANVVGTGMTIDIALFGRMVADNQSYRTDGAYRGAHAITTHEIRTETDFFAAVDELVPSGAGHIGTAEFTSGCFYEYFGIDVDLLKDNLKDFNLSDEAIQTIVKSIIYTAIFASSESKQTSMASKPFPSVVFVEKTCQSFTYANAFEKPVPATDDGYDHPSAERLRDEVKKIARIYDVLPSERYWLSVYDDVKIDDAIGTNCNSVGELLSKI